MKRLKIIVAGAHPGDPEATCGGLLALLTEAGHELVVAYLEGIAGKSHEVAESIRTREAVSSFQI
jgi:LmbE family N-acetylglucosaminyl deacetylase